MYDVGPFNPPDVHIEDAKSPSVVLDKHSFDTSTGDLEGFGSVTGLYKVDTKKGNLCMPVHACATTV